MARAQTSPREPHPHPDPEPQNEYAFLPAAGIDEDLGFKAGLFMQVAHFRDEVRPYAWRAQLGAGLSVRESEDGLEWPFREVYLRWDRPRFLHERLRLVASLSYLRTTNLGYYGVGNASPAPPAASRSFYRYDGTMPALRVTFLHTLTEELRPFATLAVRYVDIDPYANSLLAAHIATGPGAGERLYGTDEYFESLLTLGIAYDTRDHEIATTAGVHSDASLRCGAGGEPFCGANLTLRGYVPIFGEHLVLAGRLVSDVLSERATLLAVAAYGGFAGGSSIGGSRGVRGVPAGRFLGRTKVLGNIELRSHFFEFTVLGQDLRVGAAAFADAGRVWTKPFRAVPALDGHGLGVKWGVGGGPRIGWGRAMVVRVDLAHSPSGAERGTEIATYVDVEPVF